MSNFNNGRSGVVLFTTPLCILGHSARIVFFEKDIAGEMEYYVQDDPPGDLLDINPNLISPTLVERDIVLYDSRIIMEYLDERYPHPPLNHLDPTSRAFSRMVIKRIDNGWIKLYFDIVNSGEKKASKAKKELKDSLVQAKDIFGAKPFFLNDEFSLADAVIAPLLWRLPNLGISLEKEAPEIIRYSKRIFARRSFKQSLSESEKLLR